jgi:hypothetical protein
MIDYFLSSSKLFFHILDFEIKNFTPTLSDVHSQLHISLKIPKKENALTADENERSERNQARKWCIKQYTNIVNNRIYVSIAQKFTVLVSDKNSIYSVNNIL